MLERRTLLVRDHPVNLADTLVGFGPRKPPILPCTAWADGDGPHFWQRQNPERPGEADRCWYCLQSRHAARDWPLTLERALEGN